VGDSVSDVGVLNKAVSILDALSAAPLGLADLGSATGLPRATVHRLAVALECHGLVARDREGRFELGPHLRDLARAGPSDRRALVEAAGPALVMLRDVTGESVQLYVPAGDRRECVAALESPHSLRTIVRVGASLPMDRGSAGKALSGTALSGKALSGTALSGKALSGTALSSVAGPATGGWVESVEEREPGVASVSAPVVVDGAVIAAVSVSGPIERTTRQPGHKYGAAVVEAARAVAGAMT
jgi:DNA-binding IclR family transcriptional regulator